MVGQHLNPGIQAPEFILLFSIFNKVNARLLYFIALRFKDLMISNVINNVLLSWTGVYIKSHTFSLPTNVSQHSCQGAARISFSSPRQFYSPRCTIIQGSLDQDSPFSRNQGFWLEVQPTKTTPRCWFLQNVALSMPHHHCGRPVCYNQRTLASDKEFTMVNEPRPMGGSSGKSSVIVMSIVDEAGWLWVQQCCAQASTGLTCVSQRLAQ